MIYDFKFQIYGKGKETFEPESDSGIIWCYLYGFTTISAKLRIFFYRFTTKSTKYND